MLDKCLSDIADVRYKINILIDGYEKEKPDSTILNFLREMSYKQRQVYNNLYEIRRNLIGG